MRHRPWIVAGVMFQLGFFWSMLTRVPRVVSPELMAFHRAEQLARLTALLPRRRASRVPVAAVYDPRSSASQP